MSWLHLDTQMQAFSARLTSEVKLTPEMATKLATTIAADVRFLYPQQKAEIRAASPVPLEDRLDKLQAFQGWMDQAHSIRNNPFVTRAQFYRKVTSASFTYRRHVSEYWPNRVQAGLLQRSALNF